MNQNLSQPVDPEQDRITLSIGWIITGSILLVMGLILALMFVYFSKAPLGSTIGSFIQWVLVPDASKWTWYVTRAAGLTSYLLLWLSTAWGLAIPSRILDGGLHGVYTFDFHEFISLLAIGFTIMHVVVLLFDSYAPFSITQILLPFLSAYRPLWVGVGVLVLYIMLLVSITFYLRNRIGTKRFRTIHLLSLLGFFGAAVHGFFAGTDSPLSAVRYLYIGTTLSVVFLTVFWLIGKTQKKPTPNGNPVQIQARVN